MPDSSKDIWVEVLPDFSKFSQRADREMTTSLSAAGDKGARAAGSSIKGVFGGAFFGTVAASAGLALAGGIAEGLRAGVDFGLKGIDLASSLGEQVNAVQVSYGDLADGILALGKDAPKSLNLTETSFNKLAVRFSSFARTIAGKGGDVTKTVKDLTQRGADFASVYDIEVGDALQLFQSGLAGESEPLRAFGVDLSDATVTAFAYANGIAEQGKQLTEAQKVQARYGSLLSQTNQVSGDLANTSGSLANQQRALAVGIEQAQTQLGEYLLPGFSSFVGYANTAILPRIGEIIDNVGPKLAGALEASAPAVQNLLDKFTPLVESFITSAAEDGIPAFISAMNDIADNAPAWAEAFQFLVDPDNSLDDFNRGLTEFTDSINGQRGLIGDLLAGWQEELSLNSYGFYGEGVGAATQFNTGFTSEFNAGAARSRVNAEAAGVEVSSGFRNSLLARIPELRDAGVQGGAGFADGLKSKTGLVGEAGASLGREAVTNLRKELRISSPSKVFRELGQYTGDGFALGITDRQALVGASVSSMVSIPNPAGYSPVATGGAPSGGAAGVNLNFNGLDPYAAMQVAKQELGGRLDTL